MGRILIADDEDTVVKLMRRALEGAGHEVVVAVDGQEALKMAMSQDFNLYILDVRMPRLDGYSLSLSITKKFPGRKVLLITGLDTQKYESMARASGAATTLAKPFDAAQFMAQVQRLLA